MRCKSHFLLFKTDKCMKGSFEFMKKTSICYFCARKLKKMYGFTENDLLKNDFFKHFISVNHHYISKLISTDKDFLQTIDKQLLNNLNS
jgi:hypothetical protein